MSTKYEQELREATEAYSHATIIRNKTKAWYEGLENPTAEDEMIWLVAKSNHSKTARRHFDVREKIAKESAASQISSTDSADSMESKIANIMSAAIKVDKDNKGNKKDEVANMIIERKKNYVMATLRVGGPAAKFIIESFDNIVERQGWCEPFGVVLSKEEWEAFKEANKPEQIPFYKEERPEHPEDCMCYYCGEKRRESQNEKRN